MAALASLGAGLAGSRAAAAQVDLYVAPPLTDADILNFALNLEYLEAEFYLRAATGMGLPDGDAGGTGTLGQVIGGRKVHFQTKAFRLYAEEIACDEAHVRFLRTALGGAAVTRPTIDLDTTFTAVAARAGAIGPRQKFGRLRQREESLLAAYLFEDVGVTAYKGAAPITDKGVAAAGILAVEAYHAGEIRTIFYSLGLVPAGPASLRRARSARQSRGQGPGHRQPERGQHRPRRRERHRLLAQPHGGAEHRLPERSDPARGSS